MMSCVMSSNSVFPYAKSSSSVRIISILSSLAEKKNNDKQGVYAAVAFTMIPQSWEMLASSPVLL